MKLTAGYKQTEVGVIPEDWGVCNLQGVCGEAITYGIVQCGPHIQNGVPYIRVSDMNSEQLDVGGMLRTAPAIAAQFSRSRVSEGDVVYALRGKIGEVRLVDSEVAGANLTQGTARLSPNNRMNSTYLLWSLRSQHALRQGDLSAKGSTFREITLEALRQIQLPVPPITEQRAIAKALSGVDALLAKIDQFIAKKRDLKQAAMQQLLTGQIRLPGFSGEWVVKRLGEIVEIKKGQLITEKTVVLGEIPVIAGGKKPAYFHNEPNRIGKTITVSASGASAGYVALFDCPIFASDCSTISEGRHYSIEFIFFQMQLHQDAIYRAQTGGAQPHIHAVDLVPIEIGCPELKEQTAIATVLSDMDAELTALEARRDKTRALKQGMMQALLTGRIRLVGCCYNDGSD
jgi:type I restriction enzyme, S subunit